MSGRPGNAAPPPRKKSSVHTWSAPLLLKLHALPRWLVPVVMAALLVTGFILEGALAALCLLLVGLFLLWLVLLSWPVLAPTSKAIRVLVVGAVLAVAYLEAFPPA